MGEGSVPVIRRLNLHSSFPAFIGSFRGSNGEGRPAVIAPMG
jgi:hypothetical protein